jgi:hypothetical protein
MNDLIRAWEQSQPAKKVTCVTVVVVEVLFYAFAALRTTKIKAMLHLATKQLQKKKRVTTRGKIRRKK